MDLFVNNDDIYALENALAAEHGNQRLVTLTKLAWHLRQRDSSKALDLCTEIESALALKADNATEATRMLARVQLVRAEIHWLLVEMDQCREATRLAHNGFSIIDDHVGLSDAYGISSALEHLLGNLQARTEQLDLSLQHAELAQDTIRVEVARANLARNHVISAPSSDEQEKVRYYKNLRTHLDPGLRSWAHDFLALQAGQHSDYGRSATEFMHTVETCLLSGQIYRAIVAATNICYGLAAINDHEAALNWAQRALEMARPKKWPACLGISLVQTADVFRRQIRLDAASELLQEALAVLQNLRNARIYLIALRAIADIALETKNYDIALKGFQQLENHPSVQEQKDFATISYRGQAHALLYKGHASAALSCAKKALKIAQENHYPIHQMEALRVFSEIYEKSPDLEKELKATVHLPPSLHFLLMAVHVGEQIEGHIISGEIYDKIAQLYAGLGDYHLAYRYSLQAIGSREKTHTLETSNRMVSLQLRLQIERILSEGEHIKQMAAEQARRAELLEQYSDTLTRLGNIGQEITTQLNTQTVYKVLSHHVVGLLDIAHFSILLLDIQGKMLTLEYGLEDGKALAPYSIDMRNTISFAAQCARQRSEILISCGDDTRSNQQDGKRSKMESQLYSPLIVADRIIGVMTVQSTKKNAYQEHELLIFRTLCAYGAIALDNANAYQKLKETQRQLVDREKLAALGSLVAGVAHEMNTPIGNSLLIASTIHDNGKTLLQKLNQKNLTRTDLQTFLDDSQEGSRLMIRSLTSVAEMVTSFKQVAVDRTTEHKRPFNLRDTCHDIVASMRNQIVNSGHEMHLHIPDEISMNSYPGPLGQVLTNMVENALLHGFENRQHGHMQLSASVIGPGSIQIQFSDDGNGISETNITRIFEPFFTSKFGRGGSGLGLSISYNIVTSILNGQLTVASREGHGACFTMILPLEAPDLL